jgi:putative transcriptional regulator
MAVLSSFSATAGSGWSAGGLALSAKRRKMAGMREPIPDPTSLSGHLLIAMPAMTDKRFTQSVIYLCAHSAEGALGIVVNHPVAAPRFADLLKQLDLGPIPPVRDIAIRAGGPVENVRGFVLHSADWLGEGSMRVDESTALTASLDILKLIAAGDGPREAVLALGYAGWGPGQLDGEMQANAWLHAPADAAILFDNDDTTKWHRALAKLKIDPILLSSAAGRA